MQPLDPTILRPGTRLPKAVFTRHGVKLLSAEVTLSESVCRTLEQFDRQELFLASSVEELRHAGVIRPMGFGALSGGVAAPDDLITLGGVMAVESGQVIEPHHLDALELGAFAGIGARECARIRSQRMKLADEVAADREELWSRLTLTVTPEGGREDEDPRDESGWPTEAGLMEWRAPRVRALRRALARVLTGVPISVSEFEVIADDLIDTESRFPTRFASVALCSAGSEEFLADHAFSTAALCVAIGARLRWPVESVRHAALAGMLSDVGMGLVPAGVRGSTRKLDEIDANRVRRHPAFSVILLDSVEGLDPIVSLAAYQHQERENGSGYPRGLKSRQICDVARVVAVADTFAASVGRRPYKPSKRPYDALEDLVSLGSEKVLERKIVRALVEATGLFPVGSFVKLSTGDVAEVIGSHADQIDRPIVTVIRRRGRVWSRAETLDLAQHKPWELHVVFAADRPSELAA